MLRFDFPMPCCFINPVQVITAHTLAEVRPALCAVQAAADAGFYAAGYVAYEAATAFDPAMKVHAAGLSLPLVWFGVYSEPSLAENATGVGDCRVSDWQPDSDFGRYQRAIAAIREAIAAGEVYQVNHTFRLRAEFQGNPAALYRRLVDAQRPAYGAYLDLGDCCLLSASPELFFHRAGDRITTRPMKGTRPRGRWPEEDARIAAELFASAKDRAENVMIVDLLRNDLGRLAEPGSVHVPQLFEIERYPTVLQMTSTVEASLRPQTTLDDIFGALFPCGSVTGAPKISATRFIEGLETTPRQVYCGAIGYVTPNREAVFNVAIRTALLDRKAGSVEYGVGGGIVWDSTPEGEYQEAWAKAAVLTEPPPEFDLLETLRWENGVYSLLDRHLERLLSSASYFDFGVSEARVREALSNYGGELGVGAWRVRLRVSRAGAVKIESAALAPLPMGSLPVALAKTPVSCHDRFLCHKTTHRGVYDAHRLVQPNVFDVLLWNEDEELTEFTIGNLVIEQDGQLWTPPRKCGLLAGTLRAELLAEGRVRERILTRDDLATASQIWLVNSVRGFVRVHLGNITPAKEPTTPPGID